MRHVILALIAVSGVFCASCGHNIGTVMHGKYVNLGYDPEMNKFGIQYVDGLMMVGMNKELSKNSLEFADIVEKDGIKTSTTLKYGNDNGAQVTGYQVDAIKAANESKE